MHESFDILLDLVLPAGVKTYFELNPDYALEKKV